MIYAVSYNFPIGSKNVVRRNVTASTEEEALRVAGVNNPTLKAVLLPPTEKEMKEREKAERRAKTYIPGTGVKRYSADGIDKLERATEIIHWVESRISGISATVKVENTTRFAANLLEANGQEFTDTMPGFSYASDLRWYDGLTIYLKTCRNSMWRNWKRFKRAAAFVLIHPPRAIVAISSAMHLHGKCCDKVIN